MSRFEKLSKFVPLGFSLLSALLLSLPWLVGYSLAAFVGFVPLLWLHHKGTKGLLWYAALSFFLWIMATCWWVSMATPLALVMVPLVGLVFTWVPFALWVKLSKGATEPIKWVLFVTLWIAFEALYMYNDISFPWLTLGNSFTPKMAQWYSYTGVFGGSLNILIANILAVKCFVFNSDRRQKKESVIIFDKYSGMFFGVVFVPMIISAVIFHSYKEDVDPIQVAVIQPNIDPYTEKFGSMSNVQQVDIMLNLAGGAPAGTQFFVAPETAIDDQVWLHSLPNNSSLNVLRNFLKKGYSSATFVTGATTLRYMGVEEKYDYNSYKSGDIRFQVYNSALWVDSSVNVNVYHKAKLVCGVEMIPYPFVFEALDNFFKVDFGGMGGKNGRSVKRDIYAKTGTAICYEAIYGEFFTGYIKNGAEVMFVISNDGWWGDTRGHRDLVKYSAHRAIETRRSIARSANTGISAIINQRGEVEKKLGWDERGAIFATINGNDKVTFYVENGDYIVRLSLYLLGLTLVYMLGMKYYKKNNSQR